MTHQQEIWETAHVHPNCINEFCHKQDRGGCCGLCADYEQKIDKLLHQTREDTLAWVDKEVIGEDDKNPYTSDKGIKTTDNSRMFRNGLRAEQRQRLKEGKV